MIKLFCTIALMGNMSVSPILTQSLNTSTPLVSSIQPRADEKKWVYKMINGKLYKALLNVTQGRLETDWIPA